MVNKGVRALSIPARLLLIFVSAAVNKNAGIKFPNMPIPKTGKPYFLKLKALKCLYKSGIKKTEAKKIRRPATSSAENVGFSFQLMPHFISTNDVPQMIDKAIKIEKENRFVFT